MLPVIALVGRPNVGKSTLFNVLTRSRDALVADLPGLTRDRNYGYGRLGPIPYLVVDTGGLVVNAEGIEELMAKQTLRAIEEADRVLFLLDAREGCAHSDHFIAQTLRKLGHSLRESRMPGNAQIVTWDYKTGEVKAVSDPRGVGVGVVY